MHFCLFPESSLFLSLSSQIHTYIYIYAIHQLRYPISFITNTRIYLHLCYTSTTIPHIFHHKYTHIFTFMLYINYDTPYLSSQIHTYIYIYTIHQLRYPISFNANTHIFTFILNLMGACQGTFFSFSLWIFFSRKTKLQSI